MYYVSIQSYWHDAEGRRCVELASGEPGPDMLAGPHYSEHQTFWCAARGAIAVAAETGYPITRANSLVYGNPDDPCDPDELAIEAQLAEDLAPACEGCGSKEGELHTYTDYDQDISFDVCDESCFDRAMDAALPWVVTSGLSGLYMPNDVARFAEWSDARRYALETARRWQESDTDLDISEREPFDVYYSGDKSDLTIYHGNEAIEVWKVS